MANKLKLTEPGQECIMHVTGLALINGNLGKDWAFTGESGGQSVVVYVPAASAQRQFERLAIETDEPADAFVGKLVRISRSTELGKNQRPYWNVDFAKPGESAKPAPKAAAAEPQSPFPPSETGAPPRGASNAAQPDVPAAEVKRVARNAIEEAYAALYGRVAKWAQPGDVNAATATLWIDLSKRGLL